MLRGEDVVERGGLVQRGLRLAPAREGIVHLGRRAHRLEGLARESEQKLQRPDIVWKFPAILLRLDLTRLEETLQFSALFA